MQVSQNGTVSRRRIPLIVISTTIIVVLHLLGVAFTAGHTTSLEVAYPGGRVIHEAESGPSAAELAFGGLHMVGAVLAIAAAALLFRLQMPKARRAYIASAVCGLLPSPYAGLICLVCGALATETWARDRRP